MHNKEIFGFLNGLMNEVGLIKIERPRLEDKVFDDPHAHYPRIKTRKGLKKFIETLLTELDRAAITVWDKVYERVLCYQELVYIVRNSRAYEIDDRGQVSMIRNKDKTVEVYPSQELHTSSHLHVTAEGCLNLLPNGLDPRKLIELIHQQNGIAIVEHPCTKNHPIFQFILTNKEDDKLTKEVIEMADAVEVFNSYNTLWMFISNARAKKLTLNTETAKIAGSDIHYGNNDPLTRFFYRRRIGKTGIFLPKHDLTSLTGREIIELKRKDLKEGNYKRFETYTGPVTFFLTMLPPISYKEY
ncbi:hypothetical protein HYX18_00100 [Candidatus Woesearchaeota archaeon]|nr:hypothetical protein [Candidatus Woesearchaeota archaeon]